MKEVSRQDDRIQDTRKIKRSSILHKQYPTRTQDTSTGDPQGVSCCMIRNRISIQIYTLCKSVLLSTSDLEDDPATSMTILAILMSLLHFTERKGLPSSDFEMAF